MCTVKTNERRREYKRETEEERQNRFFSQLNRPALSNQAEFHPPELPLRSFSICPPAHPHAWPAAEIACPLSVASETSLAAADLPSHR